MACSCCHQQGKNKQTCGKPGPTGHRCLANKCPKPQTSCVCCGEPSAKKEECGKTHKCRARKHKSVYREPQTPTSNQAQVMSWNAGHIRDKKISLPKVTDKTRTLVKFMRKTNTNLACVVEWTSKLQAKNVCAELRRGDNGRVFDFLCTAYFQGQDTNHLLVYDTAFWRPETFKTSDEKITDMELRSRYTVWRMKFVPNNSYCFVIGVHLPNSTSRSGQHNDALGRLKDAIAWFRTKYPRDKVLVMGDFNCHRNIGQDVRNLTLHNNLQLRCPVNPIRPNPIDGIFVSQQVNAINPLEMTKVTQEHELFDHSPLGLTLSLN